MQTRFEMKKKIYKESKVSRTGRVCISGLFFVEHVFEAELYLVDIPIALPLQAQTVVAALIASLGL